MKRINSFKYHLLLLIFVLFLPMKANAQEIVVTPNHNVDYGISIEQPQEYVKDSAEVTIQIGVPYKNVIFEYFDSDSNVCYSTFEEGEPIVLTLYSDSIGGKIKCKDGDDLIIGFDITCFDQEGPNQGVGFASEYFMMSLQDEKSGIKSYTVNGKTFDAGGADRIIEKFYWSDFPEGTNTVTYSSEDMLGNISEEESSTMTGKIIYVPREEEDNKEEIGNAEINDDTSVQSDNQNDNAIVQSDNGEKESNDGKGGRKTVKICLFIIIPFAIVAGGAVYLITRKRKK